jgi:transcription termination factor Rho
MNLTELKNTPVSELITLGENMGLENLARMRKQDIIFAILKQHSKSGEDIFGDGVLEILQDGFGFLRSADSSYLAGPDDIYVSPSQIRRFNLRTGDTISGKIRPPKEGERYFALLKVNEVNYDKPENARNKILFENLTPLHANSRLRMERGNGSTEDLTARVLDLASPIGRGQRGLIVAPPKAGKTMLLQNIAQSIAYNHPDCVLMVLLIDERPEEVTEMSVWLKVKLSLLPLTSRHLATFRLPRWLSRKRSVWLSIRKTLSSCSTPLPVWRVPTTPSSRLPVKC